MREKFTPDFHDCLSKVGIDEAIFIEVIQQLVQEYEKNSLRGRVDEFIPEHEVASLELKK